MGCSACYLLAILFEQLVIVWPCTSGSATIRRGNKCCGKRCLPQTWLVYSSRGAGADCTAAHPRQEEADPAKLHRCCPAARLQIVFFSLHRAGDVARQRPRVFSFDLRTWGLCMLQATCCSHWLGGRDVKCGKGALYSVKSRDELLSFAPDVSETPRAFENSLWSGRTIDMVLKG